MEEISTFQTLRSCLHLPRFQARRGTQQSGERAFASAVGFKFLGKLDTCPESLEGAEVVIYRLYCEEISAVALGMAVPLESAACSLSLSGEQPSSPLRSNPPWLSGPSAGTAPIVVRMQDWDLVCSAVHPPFPGASSSPAWPMGFWERWSLTKSTPPQTGLSCRLGTGCGGLIRRDPGPSCLGPSAVKVQSSNHWPIGESP